MVCVERVVVVGRWGMVRYDTQVLTGKGEEYSCGNSVAVHARPCCCRSDHSCKTDEAQEKGERLLLDLIV